jgi:hypothetical protein
MPGCGSPGEPFSVGFDAMLLALASLSMARQPFGRYKSFQFVNLPFFSMEFCSSSSVTDLTWEHGYQLTELVEQIE